MFCGGCGAQLPEGMLICPKCGMMNTENTARTTPEPAAQQPQAQPAGQPVQQTQPVQGSMPEYNAYQTNPQMPGGFVPPVEQPGRGQAIASLVLGIISIVFFAVPVISVVCGIIGLVLAHLAKKAGNTSGIRTGGFVCSLIGLIIGAIVLIFTIVAAITAASLVGSMNIDLGDLGNVDNINIGDL